MIVIGVVGTFVISVLAAVLAGVTLYSGWATVRDELIARNFRSQPPGWRSIVLTAVGEVLPVCLISLFLLVLTGWLLGFLFGVLAG